ncbi:MULTISPECIES: hypothetical protein [unclassified Clostridium]|uniref:hypothetical protein n=1 Tax=unclassified Clostridium TaxID=2614128 RepID=UPI0002979D7D|nr:MULTISPECIES: hypothetical protein [unclassified Clostridium]EKQ54445.1 MAG: hypothetical protein A370_03269 [Clostridium sp. Maddingley MBC34-26]
MELEREDNYRDLQNIHEKCKRCMYYHTKLTLTDGRTFDGIIENVDPDRIIILVGEDVLARENESHSEQYRVYPGYYHPGPGPIRYRRFVRQAFPLASLAALSLLPYPYIAPPVPYPIYPYFPY